MSCKTLTHSNSERRAKDDVLRSDFHKVWSGFNGETFTLPVL